MRARLASAAIALPILAVAVWAGSPWFSLLVAAIAAIGAIELSRMMALRSRRPMAPVAAVWAVALVAGAHLVSAESSPTLISSLAAGAVAFAVVAAIVDRSEARPGLTGWGLAALAAVYTGGLLAYAPLLRELEQGREWVFAVLIVVFATDTAAFAVGRFLGRTSLAPGISPGKTWEGAIGGLLGGLAGVAVAMLLLDLDVGWGPALTLGVLMAVVAQLGDLLQSAIKRWAGVKDSGGIIPGHGGVLDRLDSIVLVLVLVYYFVVWAVQ